MGHEELGIFRAIVDASREAVAVMSPDGRVLFSNAAHDALFGRRVTAWRDDYRELWAPAAQAAIERELASPGGAWDGVLEARDVGGKSFPVLRRAGVAPGPGGRPVHFASLHPQSNFLTIAGHDLRQPLQALAMFVSVLSGREHSEANRKVIDRIEASLAATDAALSSVLEISKLDAGLVVPAITTVTIERVLAQLTEEFAPQAERAGLALRVIPSGVRVRSDAALLERLLRQLLANAVRFTPKGGILLGCRRRGGFLRIEIRDTGPGIPPDEQAAVFRPFHRLGERKDGLGLGLAIAERLADLLGHRLSLRSEPGKGSVFAVDVPLADAMG